MKKFMDKLTSFSVKISQNTVLQTITYAFMLLLPFSMVGGFAGLFNGIGYEPYQQFIGSIGLKSIFSVIYQWTTGMIGLYLSFLVAYSFATKKDLEDSKIPVALTSTVCFLIITPMIVLEEPYSMSTLPMNWLGSSGMFSAIIVSFIVGYIFKFCRKYNIVIKLPKQVPPYIANQFTALIPVVIATIVFAMISMMFAKKHPMEHSINWYIR